MSEIDVSKCPHILLKTSAFHDGEFVDDVNACKLSRFTPWGDTEECYHVCNHDCDWYELQKLEQYLDSAARGKCNDCTLDRTCCEQCSANKILQLIKQVKEDEE